MDILKRKFENELGNTINVQVNSKEIEGVPGVLIAISGPTSLTENHVTVAEAKVIYELLGTMLRGEGLQEESDNVPSSQ